MKKILAGLALIVLIMAMSVSFAACGEKLPTPEEVIDNLGKSLENMETYRMDMDMTMSMSIEAEDMPTDMPTEMDITADIIGAIDMKNQQMEMTIDMSVAGPEEEPMNMDMAMYLVDDMMYMMIDMPIMPATWMKSEIPSEFKEQMNYAGIQVDMLKAADVEVTGSEKVGDTDCYVLDFKPDIAEMLPLLMEQMQIPVMDIPDIDMEKIQEVFRDISMKLWVDKDKYYIMRTDIEGHVEITPEIMGMPEEEGAVTIEITVSMLAYDYNQPISIVLPPEAEDAVEQSPW